VNKAKAENQQRNEALIVKQIHMTPSSDLKEIILDINKALRQIEKNSIKQDAQS